MEYIVYSTHSIVFIIKSPFASISVWSKIAPPLILEPLTQKFNIFSTKTIIFSTKIIRFSTKIISSSVNSPAVPLARHRDCSLNSPTCFIIIKSAIFQQEIKIPDQQIRILE